MPKLEFKERSRLTCFFASFDLIKLTGSGGERRDRENQRGKARGETELQEDAW